MKDDSRLPPAADRYGREVSPYYNLQDKAEKYRADKLFKRLRRKVGEVIADYDLIHENDRILVGMSGGKDSYALLDLLLSLRRSAPVPFELIPVHVAAGFPATPEERLKNHLERVGLPYVWLDKPVAKLCAEHVPSGKPWCSLCSRLRRGFIYGAAREHGANVIALGHHKDDILATFFLNLFYAGILKTMPPKLVTDEGDLTVIRPLAYCRERDLTALARYRDYPLFPKGLCGFGEHEERAAMREMIKGWEKTHPKRADIAFRALKEVVPSHLLDRELFDFTGGSEQHE